MGIGRLKSNPPRAAAKRTPLGKGAIRQYLYYPLSHRKHRTLGFVLR